jgi:predicted acyltransferase
LYPPQPGSWPYEGFLAHWNKNANLGHAFDLWFLNLFPRAKPFTENGGGYLTLSFVPTLATMILGLLAGQWMRAAAPAIPYRRLLLGAAWMIPAALALHFTGLNPVVKRIWTPAWTLFSGGACLLLLALFAKLDGRWMRPLTIIGMNSIAAYLIAHLFEGFFESTWKIHLNPAMPALASGALTLAAYWLILWWMDRRKLYLRI